MIGSVRMRQWVHRGIATAVVPAATLACLMPPNARADQAARGPDLPRFYSLKSNPVNLRKGPGTNYPKSWVFRRAGLPVEILRRHERWRQVRDWDGATGWVLRTLISRRRTALVTPWLRKEPGKADTLTQLRQRPYEKARIVAQLESGTLASVKSCDKSWCQISIDGYRGYVPQESLWGVYPGEVIR